MTDADRQSRLDPGTRLLHADLHNHSMLSDGAGDPDRAFAEMRDAGLDVAALTDHASIPLHHLHRLDPADYPDAESLRLAQTAPDSLDDAGWARTGALADAADVPGTFTALRGFEWTEPWLGHANVWFSESYLSVHTPGRIDGLHEWLEVQERQALFSYNHPGREPGLFGGFRVRPTLAGRMVALEMFNRFDDYLFAGWESGQPSPLLACLRAGWRPALTGVSDEHGRRYGLAGKGRTGLWAPEHSRAGVREALLARRAYATREQGLVLDATLAGVPMGGGAVRRTGRLPLAVDLRGPAIPTGAGVELQVLGDDGGPAPAVITTHRAAAGLVEVDVDVADTPWVVLRVADPGRPPAPAGPANHPGRSYGMAYTSPWWLT